MVIAETQMASSLMDYNEEDVHLLFSSLGFPQYEQQIHEHGITGDILQALDHDTLKEVGVSSVGQRLVILKAVYNLKIRDGIPIEADHYVPPSETADIPADKLTLSQLHNHISQLENRIISLEEENYRLQETVQTCLDEVAARKDKPDGMTHTLKKQPSLKWAPFKGSRSPTKAEHESPGSSPQAMEHHLPGSKQIQSPEKNRKDTPPITASTPTPLPITNSTTSSAAPQAQSRPPRSNGVADATDIRSFKVSLDDPAWKVLPAALKKYKINNDDWQNYAMFICYGNTERCLSYDEKPLLLFQKLKDARKNPVFMLKHIRDIRSPIAVAQQKQAARKDKERQALNANNGVAPAFSKTSAGAAARAAGTVLGNGPMTATPPLATANLTVSPWPDVMSPVTAHTDRAGHGHTDMNGRGNYDRNTTSPQVESSHGPSQPLATQSYAIAIYPYSAEQDDEFDVAVNDTFVIVSRARGWWNVQKDPTGTGHPDTDTRAGWVPAGCLLETNLPVAMAVQEALSSRDYRSQELDHTPIMPTSIVSTSYPGVALMDYPKKGEEELDLVKDDSLRVFKRYNHWSYAVKETNGDRGWVPSWFIGKIGSSTAGVPPTPAPHNQSMQSMISTASSATMVDSDLRYAPDGPAPAASPVSPGFMQTSAAPQAGPRTMI